MGCVGYILKIEKLTEKIQNNNLVLEKRPKLGSFQFKFDPYSLLYAGEITDMALSELPSQGIEGSYIDDIIVSHMNMDRSGMPGETKNNSRFGKNSEDIEIVLEKKNEKNYAEGIHLLRLYNNKVGEPEEFKSESNEEDDLESENKSENKQESLFLQRDSQDEDDEEFDLDNTFKSRKALNQLINNQSVPVVIRNLKYGANILLLMLIAIAFADYFVTYQQFNVITHNFYF